MNDNSNTPSFTHRIAGHDDLHAIEELMGAAIERNMAEFLSAEEIDGARASMGVDETLIKDGTYFLIEVATAQGTKLVGCGGWGKRRTLYGGNHTVGRDDRLSDPATEPARIRAMYTHPDWIRRGIGSLLLELGEDAARRAGFRSIELGSTIPGEPLYRARGYREVERLEHRGAGGELSTVIRMAKSL